MVTGVLGGRVGSGAQSTEAVSPSDARVDLDPHRRGCLRATARPASRRSARDRAAPGRPGHPHDHARPGSARPGAARGRGRPRPAGDRRPGPSTSAPGGQRQAGEHVVDGLRLAPMSTAIREAGGRWAVRPLLEPRGRRSPAGSQRTSACRAGSGGVADGDDPPAALGRARERGGVEPAAHRLLRRPAGRPGRAAARCRAAPPRRTRPRRAAPRPAWRRRARARRRRRSSTRSPLERRTGDAGERAPELLRGAAVAHAPGARSRLARRRPGRCGPAPSAPHQRHVGGSVRPGSCSGPGQTRQRAGVAAGVARPARRRSPAAASAPGPAPTQAVADRGVGGAAAGGRRAGVRVALELDGRWPR